MNDGSARDADIEILPGTTRLVSAGAALPGFCAKLPRHSKIGECVHRRISKQEYATTVPPISTVRPAALDVFLTPETQATVPAVACLYANCGFIDEFHVGILRVKTKNPALAGFSGNDLQERGPPRDIRPLGRAPTN
jgi:hypothetical protein